MKSVARLLSELVDGAAMGGEAFILNGGDDGLLRSLDKLSAAAASQSANGGATIAAHAQHVRYGLSLMNRWFADGGNPFADAKWDAAWKTSVVGEAEWREIRGGLAAELRRWMTALGTPRELKAVELTGVLSSVAQTISGTGRPTARASSPASSSAISARSP